MVKHRRNELPMARPETIRKAIQALEEKKPRAVEHQYNRKDCKEDDQRCLNQLRQLLS